MIESLMAQEPSYLVKLAERLEKGGLKIGKRTRSEVVRAAIHWLYSTYVDRMPQSVASVSQSYGVSASAVLRIIRLAEQHNRYYLNAAARKIDWYVDFFRTSVNQVFMLNDRKPVEIRRFIDHLERVASVWRPENQLEIESFFCRYFYLLNVTPEKGRDSTRSVEVHVSPNSRNRYSVFRPERGGIADGL